MSIETLTAERLREVLRYDPLTGLFTNLVKRGNLPVGAIAGCRCHVHGYIVIGIDYEQHRAQRLAWLYMKGSWPLHEVDHRDRDRANNRWSNLRPATHAQNSTNAGNRLPNTSGYRGIVLVKRTGMWLAKVVACGRQHYFGTYVDPADAARAYDRGATQLHGEFALLNFPTASA